MDEQKLIQRGTAMVMGFLASVTAWKVSTPVFVAKELFFLTPLLALLACVYVGLGIWALMGEDKNQQKKGWYSIAAILIFLIALLLRHHLKSLTEGKFYLSSFLLLDLTVLSAVSWFYLVKKKSRRFLRKHEEIMNFLLPQKIVEGLSFLCDFKTEESWQKRNIIPEAPAVFLVILPTFFFIPFCALVHYLEPANWIGQHPIRLSLFFTLLAAFIVSQARSGYEDQKKHAKYLGLTVGLGFILSLVFFIFNISWKTLLMIIYMLIAKI